MLNVDGSGIERSVRFQVNICITAWFVVGWPSCLQYVSRVCRPDQACVGFSRDDQANIAFSQGRSYIQYIESLVCRFTSPFTTLSTMAMSVPRSPADRNSFRVAVVCALPREADAVTLLFDGSWDQEHNPSGRADGDANTYLTGRIGRHNVVLVVLPDIGTASAAAATASLRSSYTNLKLALLVGVCGGVPHIGDNHAFLGDVVVSRTVVQYDYGRQYPGHFAVKTTTEDSLGRANKEIRNMLKTFETEFVRERLQAEAATHLERLQETAREKRRRANYRFPGTDKDILYDPRYTHRHRKGCSTCTSAPGTFCGSASRASCAEAGCDPAFVVARDRPAGPVQGGYPRLEIFFGRVGSGNRVMKSGEDRDRIAAEHNLIAFEMEGAGAWDEIPCIIVKGICDYADSHKNKGWQDFAAATAASVAKAILGRYAIHDGDQAKAPANGKTLPFVNFQANRLADRRIATGRSVSGNSFGSGTWINQGDVQGDLSFRST